VPLHELAAKGAPREIRRLPMGGRAPQGRTIGVTSLYLEIDGRPAVPTMGEFPYSRYPCLDWDEELLKMKMGGVRIVASYVFWIHHEEEEGRFDWSGSRDVRTFVQLCRRHDLFVLLRIGPFVHGECRNGGLPDWLLGRPLKVRSNDPGYLAYVERYYGELGRQLEGLTFAEGGPVIGAQLENEFMNTGAPWELTEREEGRYHHFMNAGKGGVRHVRNLLGLARDAGIDVPLYTATGWGSPVPTDQVLPVLGACGYVFVDHAASPSVLPPALRHYDPSLVPFLTQEITAGMLQFYGYRPPYAEIPEQCESSVTVALGSGCNLPGIYVYHGGSNPVGRHGFLNESGTARISYDFEAPLREFGQVLPSYHRLRRLFLFLGDFGERLAPMQGLYPEGEPGIRPEDMESLRWCVRARGDEGFLFLNTFQYRLDTQPHEDVMRPNIDIQRPSDAAGQGDLPPQDASPRQAPMRPHADVAFLLHLPAGGVRIPAEGTINIPAGTSAIFPFNLPLDRGRVVSATCQPLCRLRGPDGETLVFAARRGIRPTLLLDGVTVVSARGAEVRAAGRRTHVDPQPGTGCAIVVDAGRGRRQRLLILGAEQSLGAWKVALWGCERLLLSSCPLVAADELLTLSSVGEPRISFAVLDGGPPLSARGATLRAEPDGLFTRYTASLPAVTTGVQVTMVRRDKATVAVPEDLLGRAPEVFLRIRCVGDVLHAFIDGMLVSDTFCNGSPWEIGLRRFMPRAALKGIYLHVLPLVKGTEISRKILPQMEAAFRRTFPAEEVAEIVSIDAVPEYRLRVERGEE
jgi:beta-galactosidase